MSKAIKEILKHPPQRYVFCSWCGGQGYHVTGAISTKTCKVCEGNKKKSVPDRAKQERMIRAVIKKENIVKPLVKK